MRKAIKYLMTIGGYILFFVLIHRGFGDDIFSYITLTVIIGVITLDFLQKDISEYVYKRDMRRNGTEYLAVITDIMEEGTIDTTAVKTVTMYIKVRFFDKEHELRDEWVDTKEMYDMNRDKFFYWQTVRICESNTGILLISEKAEEAAIKDTSEGAIISDREILMDKNISGRTKWPVPNEIKISKNSS